MGSYYPTMGQFKRARTDAARQVRREAILAAAGTLFAARDYDAVTVADIARRARLAKGTVFLYFPTREALALDVLEGWLHEWLEALHGSIAQDTGAWTSARLAEQIAASLGARPAMVGLLALSATFGPNVPAEHATGFRHRLFGRFFATGALIEQRLGLSRAGDGVQALLYTHALVVGLQSWSTGDPETGARATAPPHAPLHVDVSAELRTALTVLFNGFHRKTG